MDNTAVEKIQLVNEVHRPVRKNYPRRQVQVRGLDETWQADLVDMMAYTQNNDGYKYILTVIDVFSKFAWAEPIKSKNGVDVAEIMKSIILQGRVPKKLHVDKGKEFYNKHFEALLKHYGIQMYSTHSTLKASICERFNRTLKERMWKLFSLQGSYRWIDILPKIMLSYNDTKHRTIRMKPKDVTHENEETLRLSVYGNFIINKSNITGKYKVDDKVRISKYKHIFEKGYTPNWTMEIFTIRQVLNTQPITYLLKDYRDQPIEGCFYEYELTKAKYHDVYLVEKIVQRKGKKVLVKWLGFSDEHNTWETETELL